MSKDKFKIIHLSLEDSYHCELRRRRSDQVKGGRFFSVERQMPFSYYRVHCESHATQFHIYLRHQAGPLPRAETGRLALGDVLSRARYFSLKQMLRSMVKAGIAFK